MLPRIENLEKQVASIPEPALRESVDNLIRTWLRLQNEVARLASSVPEAATRAAEARIAELEERLRAAESGILRLSGNAGDTSGHAAWPRILEREKVKAAQDSGILRLSISCGSTGDQEYVHVDRRERPGVDVLAEADALPFGQASVDEIFSSHLVERFPEDAIARRVLPYWYRTLKPGGLLRVVTTDLEAMLGGLAQGAFSVEEFRTLMFGDEGREAAHRNLFTPDGLQRLVAEAGFTEIELPTRGHRNGRCFEFEVRARVPVARGSE
jgi:hypothetical protein